MPCEAPVTITVFPPAIQTPVVARSVALPVSLGWSLNAAINLMQDGGGPYLCNKADRFRHLLGVDLLHVFRPVRASSLCSGARSTSRVEPRSVLPDEERLMRN